MTTLAGRETLGADLAEVANLFDAAPKPMWVSDAVSGALLAANPAAFEALGFRPGEVPAARLAERFFGTAPGDDRVLRARRPDGAVVALRLTTSALVFQGVPARLVVGDEVDIYRSAADAQLRVAQSLARVGTWSWDIATSAVEWSDELYRIFGVSLDVRPLTLDDYVARIHRRDVDRVTRAIEASLGTVGDLAVEHRVVTPGGCVRWVRCRGQVEVDGDGRPALVVGACQDITDQKRAEASLTRQALHDGLTGLPNRTLFLDRLEGSISRLAPGSDGLGVLFLDLDRFKLINDRLGHPAGDALLREVAARLTGLVRPRDTVARFGGDEFAILYEGLVDDAAAARLAGRILEAVAAPVDIAGRPASTGASIGIVLTRDDGATAESMIRDADLAMYRAKERGRGRHVIFDTETRQRAKVRLNRAEELRVALDEGQFQLYYQPDVDLAHESSVGVEALLRWDHPVLGLLGPSDFIDIAEETGLIVRLGEWVLGEACRQVAAWSRLYGRDPLLVSVNLSARQLTQASLIDAVRSAIEANGLDPGCLCLEITESVLMEDVETSVEALLGLKKLGVRIAIDDFGTGYSSLSYLRRFPVDVVKIDRSFVAGLGVDPAADAIVAAVVNLSHALGLRVVAEGVETEEQLLAVRALGCDRAQGFYWSRPLPADELGRWAEVSRPPVTSAEPVDLLDLLTSRSEDLRQGTGRAVVLQVPPKLGSAVADLRAVKSVLDHLLANAARFSEHDRPIVVSATSDRRWVRISVTDFGVGMRPDESSRCFEQFWQADPEGVRQGSGAGIGLFIVRSLVDAMGGHVGVRSVSGKGSTFTVALPRSARAAARRGPAGTITPGVSEDSTIREFMRQLGVPNRRGA